MRISVITAVFNGGSDILVTLKSVAEQDHSEVEHIVVDGGSTDSTLETVQANSARVAVLISESDDGVYDAFNKGLRRASGEIIAFLNCGDTYLSTHALSTMASVFEDTTLEAAYADVLIVDYRDRDRVVRHYSSRYFSPATMRYGLMPAHPTLFLRRDVYQSVGEYDTAYGIAGDYEFCLRVFAKRVTKYRYLPQPLVRMPRGGLSNDGWRSKWKITREMRLACRLNSVSTSIPRLCLRFPLKMLEMF
jgi:glycosyltransferase involved in cell wall biosynthesis